MAGVSPIQAFALGADLAYLSRRDPPTAPDGQYDWQVKEDNNGTNTKSGHATITNLVKEIETLKGKGAFVPDAKAVVCAFLLMLFFGGVLTISCFIYGFFFRHRIVCVRRYGNSSYRNKRPQRRCKQS
jgi:hypothetical protein